MRGLVDWVCPLSSHLSSLALTGGGDADIKAITIIQTNPTSYFAIKYNLFVVEVEKGYVVLLPVSTRCHGIK